MAPVFPTIDRSLSRLGPRARKVLRYLGFAVLGLLCFVFAFQLTFPFDRVKAKAIEALSANYDVMIGEIERGIIPGRMYVKALSLRTRPTKASDVTTFYIDQLEVDLGLIALLRGTIAVKIDARIGNGHIKGDGARAKDGGLSVHLVGSDLPSASLPMREVLGLPMSGKVRFALELELPVDQPKTGKPGLNWAKADGSFDFACPSGCTVGDGKSKLKLTTNNARNQAFLDEGGGGIDFGKVNIDSLFATVELKSGKLDIPKFETKSGDGELHIALDMALNQDLGASLVTGCLRFRGSDALLKREPKTHAAISTTGAPLGPDNLFHIKLDGPVRTMRRLGQVCGPSVNTSMDNPAGSPTVRPNLPTEAPKPPGVVALPPPPPQQVPPPAAAPPPNTPTEAPGGDAVRIPPPSGEAPPPPAAMPPAAAPPMPGSASPPAPMPPPS